MEVSKHCDHKEPPIPRAWLTHRTLRKRDLHPCIRRGVISPHQNSHTVPTGLLPARIALTM
jgi:hypothetical protein